MILGAQNQNKNLAAAAAKRVDTSTRTKTSNAVAAKVTSSKRGSGADNVPKDTTEHVPRSTLSDSNPDPVRGSLEGLVKQSAGHIQLDKDGYDNPGFQKARYEGRAQFLKSLNETKLTSSSTFASSIKNSGIITNYSSKIDGNNIANRMSNFLNTNDMFR